MSLSNRVPAAVLIVDHHIAAREGLLSLLSIHPQFTPAECASNCGEARDLARSAQPGLILLDLRLPDCDALELLRELLVLSPASIMVAIAGGSDPVDCDAALAAGAAAFLHKDSLRRVLVATLNRLLDSR